MEEHQVATGGYGIVVKRNGSNQKKATSLQEQPVMNGHAILERQQWRVTNKVQGEGIQM